MDLAISERHRVEIEGTDHTLVKNWAIKQCVGVQRHMSELQDFGRCDYGRVDTGGWSRGLRCCICA